MRIFDHLLRCTFDLPREVCLLVSLFFSLLAGMNMMALIGTVATALQHEPPVPGLTSFVLNYFAVGGAVPSAWWWYRKWAD